MAAMKIKILLSLLGALVILAGCVGTVSGRKTAGVPLVRDTVEGRYERPVNQVFEAAKDVIKSQGALANEGTLYKETNEVKTVEGQVAQRKVWIRIEAVDPKVTSVKVQARTQGGSGDVDLAHQIEKDIALKLVTR